MFKFLTLKTQAFGLDISDLSLKIAKLEKRKKGLALASFLKKRIDPRLIERGEIKDQEALADVIEKSILEVKGKRLQTKYVVASLPEEKAFLQVIQLPLLKREEVKTAARYEAESYIPLPIDEVYLDSAIVKPVYNHLDHLDVLIAALPKAIVDPYVFCLKRAGLVPLSLEIESQAIARALVKDQVTDLPLLLLDIGATRTGFVIFSGYSIRYTSSIPVGSRGFTQAIVKNLGMEFKEAEEAKLRYGLIGPKEVKFKGKRKDGIELEKEIGRIKKLQEAQISVLVDFTEQIKKRIDYYQSHASHEHLPPNGKGVGKALLCGGGANLKGLGKFLGSELNIPVELANPWVNIFPTSPKGKVEVKKETPQISFEKSLSFTVALGLALGPFIAIEKFPF